MRSGGTERTMSTTIPMNNIYTISTLGPAAVIRGRVGENEKTAHFSHLWTTLSNLKNTRKRNPTVGSLQGVLLNELASYLRFFGFGSSNTTPNTSSNSLASSSNTIKPIPDEIPVVVQQEKPGAVDLNKISFENREKSEEVCISL